VHLQPPLHRQFAACEGGTPGLELALVLAEQVRELADGRGADPQQVQLATGGVTLKVAMQPALTGRLGQAVVGEGVVIHADRLVAIGAEALLGLLEHPDPIPLTGQLSRGNPALQRQLLGQVREREQSDPVGPQLLHQLQGAAEAFGALARQPTAEVDVDAAEGRLTQPPHHPPQLSWRLR